jgi:hypothetical protein
VNAWGVHPDDAELAKRNTQVIAINSNIIGMLPTGDVRKNYLLIGTVWNQGVGSNQLANTTLETFEQKTHCFQCHRAHRLVELNRMFETIKPLSLR